VGEGVGPPFERVTVVVGVGEGDEPPPPRERVAVGLLEGVGLLVGVGDLVREGVVVACPCPPPISAIMSKMTRRRMLVGGWWMD